MGFCRHTSRLPFRRLAERRSASGRSTWFGSTALQNGRVSNPLDAISWPQRTDRLLLRRATVDDVDRIGEIRAIDGVSDWLSTDASDRPRFDEHFRRPERLATAIVVELDGRITGDLMFKAEDAWAQAEVADDAKGVHAELGWVFDPAHAGHGYATEAVEALLRIGFEDVGIRRIVAYCFADNQASWRLMERVGMRREAHTRSDSLHRTGRWLDGYAYAILADEWRRTR
jgi:RimJ/RimL family protein N-acetyltransferase